jgi:glycosyltransferase involved in cell wall biosynthesis
MFPEFLDRESLRYYAGQIEAAVQEASHILADSEHTRSDILNQLSVPESKVTTVHLAASPGYELPLKSDVTESVKQQYKLPSEFILFVGTISPRKNIKTIIQALIQLKQEISLSIPLVIVGKRGWHSDDSFNTDGVEFIKKQITHLDDVAPDELIHIYSLASGLVLPSIYEGFGLPPLEAMHVGCPVITSDRSSLPEVVGDAGIMLDPFDIPGWVDAIQTVLANEEVRRDMIRKGRQQAQKFNWERTAVQTLEVYQKVYEDG